MNKESEKTIYFVRHGQSEGNITPVFQSADSPLSDAGKLQAEEIAKRAQNISFDALISSPLPRTAGTAAAIAQATGKKPEYSEIFVERIKPSNLSGKPQSDPKAQALWAEWQKSLATSGYRAEDGENFDDIVKRADAAIEFLFDRTEKTIMVVTHGYFLRALIARVILGDNLTDKAFKSFLSHVFTTENTAITVLKYATIYGEAAWRLWAYNDHAHLG